MKAYFTLGLLLTSLVSFGQITLTYYDLPNRGENYLSQSISNLERTDFPDEVFEASTEAMTWDLSGITGTENEDTVRFLWVEGTPYENDFPESNMVDFDPENGNQYTYFEKNQEGFFMSGYGTGLESDLGAFEITPEFRPASPLLKIPATMGDKVAEVSRASVDFLTFGEMNIKNDMSYEIDGFGTLKVPSGVEYEVIRIKRETNTELITKISFGGDGFTDTTYTEEETYEFYASGYGQPIATITVTFDPFVGLEMISFNYFDKKEVSSVSSETQKSHSLQLMVLASEKALILRQDDLAEGGVVAIYSLSGQLIKEQKAEGVATSVSLQEVPSGTYIVRTIGANGQVESKKFRL